MIELKNNLDYIDNGITNNNTKSNYILYISIIHDYFLDLEGIDFGIRYNILELSNLILTKLIDHENSSLRDNRFRLRQLIVPDLIEKDEELCDDDKYFKSS